MKLKALVVEDDFSSLELLCETLHASGIEAQGTRNALQASTMIEREKFDGIFLDLNLPELDGFELSRRIRKSEQNSTTPIIVVTGRPEKEVMKQAFASGAQFYLAKPLDRQKLRRLLNTTQGSMLQEWMKHHFVSLATQVLCRGPFGDFVARSTQIGEKGMTFAFDGVLRPGDSLQLSFRLPSSDSMVEASGTVLRITRSDGRQQADYRFETLAPSGKQALRHFLASSG